MTLNRAKSFYLLHVIQPLLTMKNKDEIFLWRMFQNAIKIACLMCNLSTNHRPLSKAKIKWSDTQMMSDI